MIKNWTQLKLIQLLQVIQLCKFEGFNFKTCISLKVQFLQFKIWEDNYNKVLPLHLYFSSFTDLETISYQISN